MATPKQTPTSGFDAVPVAGKAAILLGIVAVVAGVYYFGFHSGITDELRLAVEQQGVLEQQHREAELRQQEYLRVTQELAAREPIDRSNKRVLPEDAEIAAFLQDLNRVAELSGLQMKLVEPRPEETEQLYVRIPVSLSLEGRFHQMAKFFYNVSQLERAINMENITLSEPATNEADEVVLKVDVLATTFRRPAEGEVAAVPAAGAAQ